MNALKVVGKRRQRPETPAQYQARALILQRQVEEMNPFPRPRGFVFKARTWEEFQQWRSAQSNPRLW